MARIHPNQVHKPSALHDIMWGTKDQELKWKMLTKAEVFFGKKELGIKLLVLCLMGTRAERNWPQNSSGEWKATIFMRSPRHCSRRRMNRCRRRMVKAKLSPSLRTGDRP